MRLPSVAVRGEKPVGEPLRGRWTVAARQKAGRRAMAVAARHPRLWRFLRPGMRRRFNAMAARWDAIAGDISSPHFAAVCAGLEALPTKAPRRVADVGTGTGTLALGLALRFPGAVVTGFDLAEAMLERAWHNLRTHPQTAQLSRRVSFVCADAARLPVAEGTFDLAVLSNTLLFFAEVARVVRRGGHALIAFSHGPRTPLYLPLPEVRAGLEAVGFGVAAWGPCPGDGEFVLARRLGPPRP